MALEGMINRLTEIGRCHGMEMNVTKSKLMRISRQTFPVQMTDQKQLENGEHFNYLGRMIINNARGTHEIKSWIAVAKAAFNKKKTIFTNKFDLNLRKNPVKCCIWSRAFYGVGTWTSGKVNRKYHEGFKIWCWRRVKKIICTDRMRNEVLHRVKEQMDILRTIQ